jgi:hypothetical protein
MAAVDSQHGRGSGQGRHGPLEEVLAQAHVWQALYASSKHLGFD